MTMGVGPFFIKRRIELSDYRYRGQAEVSPTISIALANSGFIQIELIQQHDDRASIYKDFLDRYPGGLQHVSSWLTRDAFDRKKQELQKAGLSISQEGTIASSGVRLAYFSTDGKQGSMMFEIADLLEPEHYERVMGIRAAAEQWDGRQVVREVAH